MSFLLPLLGAVFGGLSANSAAKKQAKSADKTLALQKQVYNETTARFDPFLQSGTKANNALAFLNGIGDKPAGFEGFQASPGYGFRRQQGLDALEASAAARGGLFSTGAAQDAQTFGDGLASQEYGAFYNRLAGMSQSGQAAAGQTAAAGQNFSIGAGDSLASKGNALSAGIMGVNNAIQGGLGNYVGYQQFNNLLDRAYPQQ